LLQSQNIFIRASAWRFSLREKALEMVFQACFRVWKQHAGVACPANHGKLSAMRQTASTKGSYNFWLYGERT